MLSYHAVKTGALRVVVPAALAVVMTCVVVARGQGSSGLFTGQLTDANGAAMPGVAVTVVNAETGVKVYATTSDEQGFYRAPSLRASAYNLVFEAAGFKRSEVHGVQLLVDQHVRVDAVLEVGDVAETVTVTGESASALEKESSAIDETFTFAQVQNLPLASRNLLNLLTLVGGVASGGSAASISSNVLSVNGGRPLTNEIAVEGVSTLNAIVGATTSLPSTEAIREVKVQTAAYSAEYGRSAGGYINAIINSGTRDFHGGVYEYFRHDKLNANNFFNNARGIPRPSSRYNLFGGKLGGPLLLPRFGSGGPIFATSRERAFFFFNYEALRNSSPSTTTSTIPDEGFRAGDFSASPVLIRDPLRTGNCTVSDRTACFPGNRIPESRIDPAAKKIMSLLLPPNSAGILDAANGRRTNNYVNPQTLRAVKDEINLRIDTSGDEGRTRVFGRLYHSRTDDPQATFVPGTVDSATNDSTSSNYQGNLGYTQVLSADLIVEANMGFFRNNVETVPRNIVDVPGVLGIGRSPTDLVPRFLIAGYRELGTSPNSFRTQVTNTFQPSASLTWTRGANLLKAGFQLRKNQFNVFNPASIQGIYNFTGEITSPSRAANNPVNALADFLLGSVKTASYELAQPPVGRRNYNLGFFVQDDWKVTPRLTLNLGLRWEYESPVTEVNDIYSRVDVETGRLLVAGRNADRSLNLKTDRNNFAPRVGLAYSLNDRTVIRSAFGVFYAPIFANLGAGAVNFPGFTIQQNFANLGVGVAQPFSLSQGFPLVAVRNDDPFFIERAATLNNPLAPSVQFGEITPLPQTLQLTFGVQRELFDGVVAEVTYVGSRGLHLPLDLPFNQIPYERAEEIARDGSNTARQMARPFPLVGGFTSRVNAGTSTYHSLQLKGRRQFGRSFSFLSTYTWSKAIDDGSGIVDAGQPNGLDTGQYPRLFRFLERSVGSLDMPHNFSSAIVYTNERGPAFLRGFQFNPTITIRSGFPDTITQTSLNPTASQQRPSIAGDNRSLYAPERVSEGAGIRYLRAVNDPQFSLVPTGPFFVGTGANRRLALPASIGTLGRNTIREPGEFNINLSVGKQFALTERWRLLFRAEAFNLLNHTNFEAPNVALTVSADANGNPIFNSPNFGLITTAKTSRFMQMVLRLEF